MSYQQVSRVLKENKTFGIISHVQPDGDSIGSMFALARALISMGKEVEVYTRDPVPLKYCFLIPEGLQVKDVKSVAPAEILIVLDCSDFSRTGLSSEAWECFSRVVNLDHHVTNVYFGHLNLVEGEASATGEILFRLLSREGFPLNVDIAESLYVAIITDTGSFKYENTSSRTHRVTADLIEYGVDYAGISQRIFDEHPLPYMLLLSRTLSTLELYRQKIACLTINEEMRLQCGAFMEDLDGIVNYAKNIEGVEIGILIYINGNGEMKVGLRSKEADVSKLAEKFQGGGHHRAAGFRINGDYAEAKEKIIKASLEFIGG